MTETRFVQCGDVGYTLLCYPDNTVGILDTNGNVIAGWPVTAKLTADDARSRSDAELCAQVGEFAKTRKAARQP